MSRVKFYCFFLVLEICFMGAVQAASFDCKKAVTQQDKTICLDPELNRLDTAIANAFKALLKVHPLPDYVKARQTDWQELNLLCDEANLKTCLQNSFKTRVDELNWSSSTLVFSSKKPFNFANADAVVELNPSTKKISIWGGFIEHKKATAESEKPVYVGCQFDGELAEVLAANQPSFATSQQEGDTTQIELKVVGNQLFLTDPSEDICVDKAVVPTVFYRAK
jgi:uncharacterized protein